MSSGYVIASVTVTNPTQYEEYRKWSTLAMQAHGAEVCVRGGKVEVLEGDWNPGRTVILKFASFDAARAFYDTPEYQKAKAAREGAAIMRMVCVECVGETFSELTLVGLYPVRTCRLIHYQISSIK